ncbi:MAG: hypothetical protein HY912_12480 [Desulfomonile tiedjei]|uniref:Uncharacterized protein n=1 Tax=Desulfomonile tiedjei TaxID=2358 RepID=A0A9D6Z0U4_9BACT|nr:hypothetical protein [Desulfomonile tiedjei]
MVPGNSKFDNITERVIEKRIDELIEAGWDVLYSDFDVRAFDQWKKRAFSCLTVLLGPDHTYTKSFGNYVDAAEEISLLVGGGILTAAKEQMTNTGSRTNS